MGSPGAIKDKTFMREEDLMAQNQNGGMNGCRWTRLPDHKIGIVLAKNLTAGRVQKIKELCIYQLTVRYYAKIGTVVIPGRQVSFKEFACEIGEILDMPVTGLCVILQ